MGSLKSMAYAIFCVVMSTILLSFGMEVAHEFITKLFGSVTTLAYAGDLVMTVGVICLAMGVMWHVGKVSSERNLVVTKVAYWVGSLLGVAMWFIGHIAIVFGIGLGAGEVYFTYIFPQLSLPIGVGAGIGVALLAIGTCIVATKRWYWFCYNMCGADNALKHAAEVTGSEWFGEADGETRAHRVWARRFVVLAVGYGVARALQADLGFSDYALVAWTLGVSIVLHQVIRVLHKPSTVTALEAKKAKKAEEAKKAEAEKAEAEKAGRYVIKLS